MLASKVLKFKRAVVANLVKARAVLGVILFLKTDLVCSLLLRLYREKGYVKRVCNN